MGRPKGSKNKPKSPTPEVAIAPAASNETPVEVPAKKRGRPPGSKNKPKDETPATPEAAAPPQPKAVVPAATEATTKRRGRPPGSKNKLKDEAAPPSPAAVSDDEDKDEESETSAAAPTPPPVTETVGSPQYIVEDLKHPKMKPFIDGIVLFADAASQKRKDFYAEKAIPGVSYHHRVAKTVIDFLEIDVKSIIGAKA